MKIAVVGAGAMGSVYSGFLGDAGHEVWVIDTWREHVDAIRERGLRVAGASGDRIVRVHATTEPSAIGEAELVVIATKAIAREVIGDRAEVRPRVAEQVDPGCEQEQTANRSLGGDQR